MAAVSGQGLDAVETGNIQLPSRGQSYGCECSFSIYFNLYTLKYSGSIYVLNILKYIVLNFQAQVGGTAGCASTRYRRHVIQVFSSIDVQVLLSFASSPTTPCPMIELFPSLLNQALIRQQLLAGWMLNT